MLVVGAVLDGRHRAHGPAGGPAVDEVQLVVAQVGHLGVVGGQHHDGAAVGLARGARPTTRSRLRSSSSLVGLVGEQHVRLDHQRPGHRDPLQLAPGELGDQPLREVADPDPLQGGQGRAVGGGGGEYAGAQGDRTFSSAVSEGTRP